MTEAQYPQSVGLTVGGPAVMVLRKARPPVRGVLNVPPDSFTDGGRILDPGLAIAHDMELASQLADLINMGGESTRPGAESPTVVVEPNRVVLVVQGLARLTDAPLSVDISRREVMREAVRVGGSVIHDVRALLMPGAESSAAEPGVPVCLTLRQGEPRAMQRPPAIATWSRSFPLIVDRMRAGGPAGVNRELMLIDPDFGFGTTFAPPHTSRRAAAVHSARIMVEICQMGVLAAFAGRPVQRRVIGSVAAALIAIKRRAIVVRAHDRVSQRTASAFVACDRREYGHDQRF